MVGRRDAAMYHCALCSDSFTSKITYVYLTTSASISLILGSYTRHLATHDEPEAAQWPCPVCSFSFADSHALEMHKSQTGHSAVVCDKCGKTFKAEVRLNQHKEFPSPCYADASRLFRSAAASQPVQAPVRPPTQGHRGYVDLDAPVSAEAPTGK